MWSAFFTLRKRIWILSGLDSVVLSKRVVKRCMTVQVSRNCLLALGQHQCQWQRSRAGSTGWPAVRTSTTVAHAMVMMFGVSVSVLSELNMPIQRVPQWMPIVRQCPSSLIKHEIQEPSLRD